MDGIDGIDGVDGIDVNDGDEIDDTNDGNNDMDDFGEINFGEEDFDDSIKIVRKVSPDSNKSDDSIKSNHSSEAEIDLAGIPLKNSKSIFMKKKSDLQPSLFLRHIQKPVPRNILDNPLY